MAAPLVVSLGVGPDLHLAIVRGDGFRLQVSTGPDFDDVADVAVSESDLCAISVMVAEALEAACA